MTNHVCDLDLGAGRDGDVVSLQRDVHKRASVPVPLVSRAALGSVDLPPYFRGFLGLWFMWPVIGHPLSLPEVSQHSGGINPFTRARVELQLRQDLAWVGGSTAEVAAVAAQAQKPQPVFSFPTWVWAQVEPGIPY